MALAALAGASAASFEHEILHRSSKSRARVGVLHTPHGDVQTPGFVPVATSAALKGVTPAQADAAGCELMFCNTCAALRNSAHYRKFLSPPQPHRYHLVVHPGADVVGAAGGLHKFMGRDRPLITDSGGFQVFSLAQATADDGPELKQRHGAKDDMGSVLAVSERGVTFRSYHDGSAIELTPESSVRAQKALGADIIIPLDELPPLGVSRERLAQSVALSHRWMERSLDEHLRDPRAQAMYAVVHGGVDRELRAASVAHLAALPFDGMAIGGSLGKDRDEMLSLLRYLTPLLPDGRPNHLLGIADERSVGEAVPLGIDTFDSCFPTRVARHGTLFTRAGRVNIGSGKHKADFGPIDPSVPTVECSRAYLHHLYKMREPLFDTLASIHNLQWMNAKMAETREAILANEI